MKTITSMSKRNGLKCENGGTSVIERTKKLRLLKGIIRRILGQTSVSRSKTKKAIKLAISFVTSGKNRSVKSVHVTVGLSGDDEAFWDSLLVECPFLVSNLPPIWANLV